MPIDLRRAWFLACEHAAMVAFLSGRKYDPMIAHREYFKYTRP